jgi:hypothetical protein
VAAEESGSDDGEKESSTEKEKWEGDKSEDKTACELTSVSDRSEDKAFSEEFELVSVSDRAERSESDLSDEVFA